MTASGPDDWSLGAVNAVTTSTHCARHDSTIHAACTIVKLDTEIMDEDERTCI